MRASIILSTAAALIAAAIAPLAPAFAKGGGHGHSDHHSGHAPAFHSSQPSRHRRDEQ